MRSSVLIVALVFCGLLASSAVLAEAAASPVVPNLVAIIVKPNTTSHPMTPRATNTTAHTPRATNTTAHTPRATNTTAHTPRATNTTAHTPRATNTTAHTPRATNTTAHTPRATNTTAHTPRATNTTAHTPRATNTTAHTPRATNTTAHTPRATNTTAHTPRATNTTAHTPRATNTTAHTPRATNTTAHTPRATNTTAHTPRATNTTAHTPRATNTTAHSTTTIHALTTTLPTLVPNFSLPETGHYIVSIKNATCIKATIGIQLIVKQKAKDLYFNIPPAKTVTSGKCGNIASWIILKFNSGFVNFTFVKDVKQYYISEISVALDATNNLGTSYHGIVKHMKLFKTTVGYSYLCKSKQVVAFSTDSLQILTVNAQLQAFDIPGGKFGKVEECFLDSRFIVPIAFGVSLFVLIMVVIIVYLACRRRRLEGYQRI
ncbi:lysosome-associated membrane glycoprotein 3 [Carcharodon carcharias]|uniref:lysosome-associated membrane glycoprotein 3 n=1 Tax=Carcharodon carcharias TaxID=13397 RepID=UPI001B7E550B|nr:lysosome-associated membrane glycoprotein 3 [Carcharodon carcharias]